MTGLQIQRAMRAIRQAGATDVTLCNRDKPCQKRRQSQDKTHPEEALGGVEDLHGNAERGVLGVRPALHALGGVHDECALDRRQADDDGFLHGVLADSAQSVDAQAERCELGFLIVALACYRDEAFYKELTGSMSPK